MADRALLFAGPPGTGTTALALRVSQELDSEVPFCPMVAVGVIYIKANSEAVKRVGRSDAFATKFDLEAEKYVPLPKGEVHKKEMVQDVTLHDLDAANARSQGGQYISYASLKVVLYYGGAFVVSPHTGGKKYEAKKKLVKNNVEVKKLSVEEINDMFSYVIGPLDWLYYFRNGITPDNGYKLLERDDQVPELVYV
ncbi:hypothetical protein POM88_013190 [Heracleum sosnowskyi]|uniref:RuvB-like helicase n=1 Tax=Heracleum sosnowskyi TaxID=360622 RepID=A0AAD8IXX2_9APIA|nr:hypothetical protein POM88_013190 [Heracleum sosnowskyi]